MKPLSEFLEQFRAGLAPPGPSTGRVMPPEDVASRLRHELAPLFDAIDVVEKECTAVAEAGEAQAERLIDEAEHRAAASVATAEDGAPETRSRASASRTREIDDEIDAMLRDARDEIDRIRTASDAAVGDLVARVLACVESQTLGSR